jgi:phosphatidylinositol glycan class K
MLPENHACNPRNKYQAQLFVQLDHEINYYCDDIEIDYKSDDLTFDAILNLLRRRYNPDVSFLQLSK